MMKRIGLFLQHITASLPAPMALAMGGLLREQYGAQSPGIGDARQRLPQHGLHDGGGTATFKHRAHGHDFRLTAKQMLVHGTSHFRRLLGAHRQHFRLAM